MITTNSNLPPAVQAHLDRVLISTPYPNLIHGLVADYREMPAHGGVIWRGRRYNALATAQVPLGPSGQTPPPQTLSALDIDARINWYGTFVVINEQVQISHQEPVLNEAALRLGQSMRETQDILLRDMLAASMSVISATGGVNGDNPTNISGSDIERVQRALIGNNAWTVTDHIAGEDRYATSPVRNAFVAMCHTDLIADLDAIPNFTNKANYANYDKSMVSEWGVYRNVRFFVSTIGSVDLNASALGANVYNVLTVGLEAYACIKQNLASAKFIYRDPLLNDPLGQNASAGFKFASAQTILHDEWVQRLRCTVV
jgi:N4-gp56 family major capsid protein